MNVCIALHENEKMYGYVYEVVFLSPCMDNVFKKLQEVSG